MNRFLILTLFIYYMFNYAFIKFKLYLNFWKFEISFYYYAICIL